MLLPVTQNPPGSSGMYINRQDIIQQLVSAFVLSGLDQAHSHDCQNEEADRLLPSPPPFPLKVGLLNPARGSGERCKLPQPVWGGAPAEIDFGAF